MRRPCTGKPAADLGACGVMGGHRHIQALDGWMVDRAGPMRAGEIKVIITHLVWMRMGRRGGVTSERELGACVVGHS